MIGAALALLTLQSAAADPPPPIRISQLIRYGDDPCPQSTEELIVVCVVRSEADRYRIPEELRTPPRGERSWASRVEEMRYVGLSGIGSCSPVGPAGFTGCFEQFIHQAKTERKWRSDVDWAALVEKAKRDRDAEFGGAVGERSGDAP